MRKHTAASPSAPSTSSPSSSRSPRGAVRAVLSRTLLAATLGASAYLGLGALSGATTPVAHTVSHTVTASVGYGPLCNSAEAGC
jgi:hypothetical protein